MIFHSISVPICAMHLQFKYLHQRISSTISYVLKSKEGRYTISSIFRKRPWNRRMRRIYSLQIMLSAHPKPLNARDSWTTIGYDNATAKFPWRACFTCPDGGFQITQSLKPRKFIVRGESHVRLCTCTYGSIESAILRMQCRRTAVSAIVCPFNVYTHPANYLINFIERL